MSQPLKSAPSPEPDAPEPYVSQVDRRTALTWVGVVGAALAGGAGVVVYGEMKTDPVRRGYGTDPKLVNPAPAPWSRIMTAAQLQSAAILADFILPASNGAPSASSLGVPDFIDEWVSAPYPDQQKDAPLILNGLNDLAWASQRRFGVDFLKASAAQRGEVMTALQAAAPSAPRGFFHRFRSLVVGAYYTTPVGFKDIGYIGNVARTADPGPSDEVKAHLERELAKLGL